MADEVAGAVRRTPRPADDHQAPVADAQPGRGVTITGSPVSPDAGNGTGDLRAKLIELLRAADAAHYGGPQADPSGRPLDYCHLAEAILAAGWCPASDPDVLIGHFVDFAKTFRPVTEERP